MVGSLASTPNLPIATRGAASRASIPIVRCLDMTDVRATRAMAPAGQMMFDGAEVCQRSGPIDELVTYTGRGY
jgi:hypothetical protein